MKDVEVPQKQVRSTVGRYAELYEILPVGFLTLDRVGRILDLNERAARLLGFPAAWLTQRPLVVFVAKHDVRRFLAFLTRAGNNPEQQAIELDLVVGGHSVPVQISMISSHGPDGVIHHMTVVDVTDTKRIEQQLQEALENWHSLVQNVPDVIMTVDGHGKIAFANRAVWGCSANA